MQDQWSECYYPFKWVSIEEYEKLTEHLAELQEGQVNKAVKAIREVDPHGWTLPRGAKP